MRGRVGDQWHFRSMSDLPRAVQHSARRWLGILRGDSGWLGGRAVLPPPNLAFAIDDRPSRLLGHEHTA